MYRAEVRWEADFVQPLKRQVQYMVMFELQGCDLGGLEERFWALKMQICTKDTRRNMTMAISLIRCIMRKQKRSGSVNG